MPDAAALNLDVFFPLDLPAAAQGLPLSEFHTESIKPEGPPVSLQISLHHNWEAVDIGAVRPDALGFLEIKQFRLGGQPSAALRVWMLALRWEVHPADLIAIWLSRAGHRRLAENRLKTPMGELPDFHTTHGRASHPLASRTVGLRHDQTLFVVQASLELEAFEPRAREILFTLGSLRTVPPGKPTPIEKLGIHKLQSPAARFSAPDSWKAESRSCLRKPQGDALLLTSQAPHMGPAAIGLETIPDAPDFDAGLFLDALRRGLNRKGLVFGDPRISAGAPTQQISEVTRFESLGMINSVSVEVLITVLRHEDDWAALWCLAPSSDQFGAAKAIARRAYELACDSFQFVKPQAPPRR